MNLVAHLDFSNMFSFSGKLNVGLGMNIGGRVENSLCLGLFVFAVHSRTSTSIKMD
jgi:hypothetical protein